MSNLSTFFPSGGGIKSVQRGTISLPNGFSNNNTNISSVDLSKSFLSVSTAANSSSAAHADVRVRFGTSSRVDFYRSSNSGTVAYVAWEVIEFE